MEGLLTKKQNYGISLSKSKPSPLSMHKNSHSISKPGNNNLINNNKPKIRIIHIFAPEIIKTDAENFRELVQRLTGKPTEKDCPNKQIKITKPRMFQTRGEDEDEDHDRAKAFQISKPLAKKLDMNKITSPESLGFDSRVKEEEQEEGSEEVGVWDINGHDDHENSNSVPGGGFLDRFSDLEGLIEEFNGEFLPSLLNPNLDAGSHIQYGFGLGGPQLA